MKKLQINTKQFRKVESVEIRAADDASNDRVMEFSFSSEVPYERYYGYEIISHEKGAMNLERLNAAHPLLFNHDMDQHLGVIEKAWIGDDRKGHVRVRFGSSVLASEKLQDVKDKILSLVSFGYMIDEMKLTKAGSGSTPDEYTVTKCTPFEVSFVTIPADYSVGIGRAINGERELEIDAEIPPTAEEIEAAKLIQQQKEIEANKLTASQTAADERNIMDEIAKAAAAAKQAEKDRASTIDALGEKFKDAELARQLKEGDKSIDEARAAFIEKHVGKQTAVTGTEADVGLSEADIKRFSFLRLIHALANPHDQGAQKAAAFERECSMAAEKRYGKAAQGFMVPFEVLAAKRDMTAGSASAGGNVVATDLKPESFIDILRNASITAQIGATILDGLVGNISIPRQASASTVGHVAENSAVSESAISFDQVTMNPKSVGAYVDISRRLTLQNSLSVENLVKADLARQMALMIDSKAFYGSGSSNQPTGIQLVSGIGSVDFAGNAPTYAELLQMESEIAVDNADGGGLVFVTNARGRGVLKNVFTNATYGEKPVWDMNQVLGYKAFVSNQVSQVASSKEHYWLLDPKQLLLGFWGGLDIMTDPYTGATAGTVRIVTMQDYDVAVRHPEAFCIGANLT